MHPRPCRSSNPATARRNVLCAAAPSRYGLRVPRAGISVAFAFAAWCVCWSGLAHAQQPAYGAATRSSVVFFAPQQLPPEVRSALEDALATQLSLLHATVYYAGPASREGDPLERVRSARRAAARYGAIATFWLDAPTNQAWVLYAADAGITRVVVRRLASGQASVEANIEAVALIVRATTDALLHGEPMPAEEISEEGKASAPWPVEQLERGSHGVRIGAAYAGTTFAKERRWQHGVSLRAAWIFPSGPYVGLGFTYFERMQFDIAPVRFEIDRYPVSLHAGLRFGASRITFIGELGVELEIRNRRTLSVTDKDIELSSPDRSSVINICPKLETELLLFPGLVLFGGAGLDFVIGNFPYSILHQETMESSISLEPYLIRLNVHLGMAFLH